MKTTLRLCSTAAALALGLLGASSVFAQGTWNLGTASAASGACNASSSPAVASCGAGVNGSSGGVQAGISAWGNTGSGTSFVQYNLGNNDPSGFGALVQGGNETSVNNHHAFDNSTTGCGSGGTTNTGCGGTQEFMLISFGSAKVNLSAMQIGYFGGDADISIYRWDGNTAASTAGTSLAAGWTLVSSMDVDTNGAGCVNANDSASYCKQFDVGSSGAAVAGATNLYSSWWLISTYVGAANAAKSLESPNNNDAFKILSFSAGTCAGTITGGSSGTAGTSTANNGSSCSTAGGGAPEPGSLALAGLAMVGVLATRRRTRSAA